MAMAPLPRGDGSAPAAAASAAAASAGAGSWQGLPAAPAARSPRPGLQKPEFSNLAMQQIKK